MLKKYIQERNKEAILAYLEDLHGHDIANEVSQLTDEDKDYLYEILEPLQVAEILAYMNPQEAADTLAEFDLDLQKEIVEELDPDDAADIIQELETDEQEDLINILDKEEDVLKLLEFDEDEAGSHMTNEFIKVSMDSDVKQATKQLIKDAPLVESIHTIFVVDEQNKYVGQLPLKKLIKAKTPLLIKDILETEPTVNAKSSVDDLVKHMKHYGGYEIAVTDDANTLLGIITIDDILDIYQEESQEDYEKLAALPDTSIEENFFKSSIHRLPWLIILLVLSIPIALITQMYEEIIASVLILAFFQPLILDAGGDVASQTLAVTLVSMTNKDSNTYKNGLKEIMSGFISGFVLAGITFIAIYLFGDLFAIEHIFETSVVIAIALWITVVSGPTLGFFIPIILKAFKIDPAVASGPFITTFIDIASLVVYFGLATIILGGLVQ